MRSNLRLRETIHKKQSGSLHCLSFRDIIHKVQKEGDMVHERQK